MANPTVSQIWLPDFAEGGGSRPGARERRRAHRYPLRIALNYRGAENPTHPDGRGETCDISSKGLRFTTEELPGPGVMLEVSLLWPLRLGDTLPLRLILTGPVLRTDWRGAVMLIKNFHFVREAELENPQAAVGITG